MITETVKYIGVNDRKTDLFEGQYIIPNGMAYNSYAVIDEKVAVFDTVDKKFGEEWFLNLEKALSGREPDYLIVSHMEPDHSANIKLFADKYPSAIIVATAQAFNMMNRFFATDYSQRRVVATDGAEISLGRRVLKFFTAPMVHWPEVMMTYDNWDKVLFSADGFGKFGTLDTDEDWACEARRYYFGIVGKYGAQVQALLKKIADLDIEIICPLHGPILKENLKYYLDLYNTWSSYSVEEPGVVINYTSVYGNTESGAKMLSELLQASGKCKVALNDLARCDMAEAVEDTFRYSHAIFATTTYNGDIFPFMREFITHLTERNYQNRTVGFMENGSWAATAEKVMKKMTENCKNLNVLESSVHIKSALNEESIAEIHAMADEILKSF